MTAPRPQPIGEQAPGRPAPAALPRILLLSLGGTISMTASAAGGIVPKLSAADIMRSVPGIDAVADIETLSPMTVPGASLTIDDVLAVARLLDARLHSDIDGAVVVQGTDTIEETAFLLDLVVGSDRPVVVTGAMRGAEAAGADGPANVLASTIVAAAPDASGLGTLVVLNDEIHAARWVQKSHTGLPSAFKSPAGSLGVVSEGQARFHFRIPVQHRLIACGSEGDMPVALIRMSLGDDGRMLRDARSLGYRGVVLEGMGAGHVPARVAPVVGEVAKTMPIILASRVRSGPLFASTYAFPGSEIDLRQRGVIPAGQLDGLKARLLLSLLLRNGCDSRAIRDTFALHA